MRGAAAGALRGRGESSEMDRLFGRDEAEALLETVRPLVEELQALRRESLELDVQFQQLHWKARGNGHDDLDDALTKVQRRREAANSALGERVDRLRGMGVLVKDLDMGLVDFPWQRGDRVVYLCWKLGEPAIKWWHEVDTGYGARQRLDD
jgi:hypothetical protein